MKAITCAFAAPTDSSPSLQAVELAEPALRPRDLLVAVKGVSVNPVDVKVRDRLQSGDSAKVLGFDASGTVCAVGAEVEHFAVGDEVYYAGDLTRAGSNAERQAVDERIVARKPSTLDFADAAGMPLTSITAWELLFETLGVSEGAGQGESLLVIGGAGGVGSILIQLAKQLTSLQVIATASRDETRAWVLKMGADHVINHHNDLQDEVSALGIQPNYVAALTATDQHFDAIVELIKPRGRIALIDDPGVLDISPLKPKALSIGWEFMFTRSMFQTDDIDMQHQLLTRVAKMLDQGALMSTVNRHFDSLSVETLSAAHEYQESGRSIGKSVLRGLGDN